MTYLPAVVHQLRPELHPTGREMDYSHLDRVPWAARFYTPGERLYRVQVAREDWVRTGYIGRTTGWKPAWILLARSDSSGSPDVLDSRDRCIGWKPPGKSKYEEVSL